MHLSPHGKSLTPPPPPPCPGNPVPPQRCLKQSSSEQAKGRQRAEGVHSQSGLCDTPARPDSRSSPLVTAVIWGKGWKATVRQHKRCNSHPRARVQTSARTYTSTRPFGAAWREDKRRLRARAHTPVCTHGGSQMEDRTLNVSQQCTLAAMQANSMPGPSSRSTARPREATPSFHSALLRGTRNTTRAFLDTPST